ncbi:Putative serine/threonine-protein kinase R436 [Durusdinium trenchii]|uniref:non-specific serine/threonine protein kinase n=1 Tax=Durusdinium trenchii TaxID=1381693 RepID=A0ABP0IQL3_9DINO
MMSMYLWAAAWLLHPTLAIRAVDDVDDEVSVSVDLERHVAWNRPGMVKEPTMDQLPGPWKDRLSKVRVLGSGSFGTVYQLRATCDATNEEFVSLKLMAKDRDAYKEVKNMRRMQGAHYVISTVGKPDYVETPDTMDILMPYLNGGDMHDLWKKCMKTKGCVSCEKGMCWDQLGPPYSNAYIFALFYQATLGVQEIHSKGFVHMDIKSENIMLNCIDQKCFAHVIDLGLMGPRGACNLGGTPGYMAPEIWKVIVSKSGKLWKEIGQGQPQNDVYSLGVVLYELAHPGKQPPFYSDRAAHRISTYDPSTDPVLSGPEQSELDRLIISMLNPDHETRIGTAEILQRLMGYLLTMPDFTPEIIEMISLTPQAAHGEVPLPKCLWSWHRPLPDIGDQNFTRNACGDDSTEATEATSDGGSTAEKVCQCHVLRKGTVVQEEFQAPECL